MPARAPVRSAAPRHASPLTDALRARAPTAPAKGAGVQRQRPARGTAPRSSKSSAVHGHARNAAQTASIAPPPIPPTHSGDSPSDNDTHPARPRPPRRGPRRRNHTAQRARVRRRRRPTPRAVLLPAPRGLHRLPRRLERRARAHGARVCALARRRGQRARVRHRQGNHRACNGTSAHDRPSVVRGTAANARAYDRRARPWCGCEPTPDRRSQRLRMWSRAPAPHLRRRQRRRPIGALRRPRRRSAPRSAPRCSDMVRGRRM